MKSPRVIRGGKGLAPENRVSGSDRPHDPRAARFGFEAEESPDRGGLQGRKAEGQGQRGLVALRSPRSGTGSSRAEFDGLHGQVYLGLDGLRLPPLLELRRGRLREPGFIDLDYDVKLFGRGRFVSGWSSARSAGGYAPAQRTWERERTVSPVGKVLWAGAERRALSIGGDARWSLWKSRNELSSA